MFWVILKYSSFVFVVVADNTADKSALVFAIVYVAVAVSPLAVSLETLIIAFNGQAETTTISLLAIQELTRNPYYSAAISVLIACVSIPFVFVVRKLLNKVYPIVEV